MQGNEKERKIMMANNVKSEHTDMKQNKQALGNDMWNFCGNLWFCKTRIVDLKCLGTLTLIFVETIMS
jgi:hypothetical protein